MREIYESIMTRILFTIIQIRIQVLKYVRNEAIL